MTYITEGYTKLLVRELEEKESHVKQMPAGDERQRRVSVIERVRGLLIALDNAVEKGNQKDRQIDEIEEWMMRI